MADAVGVTCYFFRTPDWPDLCTRRHFLRRKTRGAAADTLRLGFMGKKRCRERESVINSATRGKLTIRRNELSSLRQMILRKRGIFFLFEPADYFFLEICAAAVFVTTRSGNTNEQPLRSVESNIPRWWRWWFSLKKKERLFSLDTNSCSVHDECSSPNGWLAKRTRRSTKRKCCHLTSASERFDAVAPVHGVAQPSARMRNRHFLFFTYLTAQSGGEEGKSLPGLSVTTTLLRGYFEGLIQSPEKDKHAPNRSDFMANRSFENALENYSITGIQNYPHIIPFCFLLGMC